MGRPSQYTREFKAQAVDLVNNTDRTQADVVCRMMGAVSSLPILPLSAASTTNTSVAAINRETPLEVGLDMRVRGRACVLIP